MLIKTRSVNQQKQLSAGFGGSLQQILTAGWLVSLALSVLEALVC